MFDVAQLAGVSASTVSRVVNHSPHVAPITAERVRDAMAKLGFRPNQMARNLRQGRNLTMVGLVVDDISNPFHASLGRAVDDMARERGALLVVASSGSDADREREIVTSLVDRGLDGLLLYPTAADHGYLADVRTADRPIVLLGRRLPDIEADSVLADNVGGAMQAVGHLYQHGHRRIAAIVYGRADNASDDPSRDHRMGRLAGYRKALEAAGLVVEPNLVRHCSGEAEAKDAVRSLMSTANPPTSLFTLNNRMTVGALHALGAGLSGIALVGFDDFALADVFDPPITVVAQDPYEMGRHAAGALFGRLAGDSGPPEHSTMPMKLIPRGSGELGPRP